MISSPGEDILYETSMSYGNEDVVFGSSSLAYLFCACLVLPRTTIQSDRWRAV